MQQLQKAVEERDVAEQQATFLEQQLNRSKKDLHLTRQKLAAANQEQSNQQHRIEDLQKALRRVEADCATKRDQIVQFTRQLRDSNNEVSVLRKKHSSAKMSEAEISALQQNFVSLQQVATEYQKQFVEAKNAAVEYQKKYDACEKELVATMLKLQKLKISCKKVG